MVLRKSIKYSTCDLLFRLVKRCRNSGTRDVKHHFLILILEVDGMGEGGSGGELRSGGFF